MKDLQFEKPTAVEEIKSEGNSGRFTFRPLERGYGQTLGNALRRTLLSSLPGVAIVSVKIDGVSHEFSTIEGVYEDVMGIILNLKKVVFKTDAQDINFEQKLEVYATGPGVVTAGDINLVDDIEVINPEQVIATLSETARLSMEVTIRRGMGYVSANENKVHTKGQTDVIAIDSIFAPIERVVFDVEKVRGDLEELTIDIDTNGSILAKDALAVASKVLVDYLNVLVDASETAINSNFIREQQLQEASKRNDVKLEQLDLSVRLYNALKRQGITTIGELVKLPEEIVIRFRSLGKKSFKELKDKLAEQGLEFEQSGNKDIDYSQYDFGPDSDEDKE